MTMLTSSDRFGYLGQVAKSWAVRAGRAVAMEVGRANGGSG
jgi:hypothetical protein